MNSLNWSVVDATGLGGDAPLFLVYEHASHFIPSELDNLGLNPEDRYCHAVGDIGTADLAYHLSATLDYPLVSSAISRLVFDCNRAEMASDSIAENCELYHIGGNSGLTSEQKRARFEAVHQPFHQQSAKVLEQQTAHDSEVFFLLTIHSFTPTFHGVSRELDIGFVHSVNDRLALTLYNIEQQRDDFRCSVNAPYSAEDGITYTIDAHGASRDLDCAIIEIANSLINTPDKAH